MTNREWLESLTDEQLALFLTSGVPIVDKEAYYGIGKVSCVSIQDIKWRYTQSNSGIVDWLGRPQEFTLLPTNTTFDRKEGIVV